MKYYLILLLLLPLSCLAQLKISGKVINSKTLKPVANASVFLSNATVGGKSADNGSYNLTNVRPGQYDLVVTSIGYAAHRQTVMATGHNIVLPDIYLIPEVTQLKEVKIKPNDNWAKYYAIFKKEFLGTSAFAKQCKILNPDVIELDYDKTSEQLSASSSDFIEIENKALGYKIKYLLQGFIKDDKTQELHYEGSALFEEMQGTPAQKAQWIKQRNQIYYGSAMHFFRSANANTLLKEGFKVKKLLRKPNPDYEPGSTGKKSYQYIETLFDNVLTAGEFTKPTQEEGIFSLTYEGFLLHVAYNNKAESTDHASHKQLTIVSLRGVSGLFDNNGVITNPNSVIYEGAWGNSRIAELLPADFEIKAEQ
jgi:hypothetical protein